VAGVAMHTPLCQVTAAFGEMSDELGAALHREVTVEGGHVLMDGGLAEAESRSDLLFAVALE